jgi:hypothetical protein
MASSIQVGYEFFRQGLVSDLANLTLLGITDFYPRTVIDSAVYGFITYSPGSPMAGTKTNDSVIVYIGGPWTLEIILDRDADVDELAAIEARVMSLFHGKQFIATTSGMLESCDWRDSFDLPYDLTSGAYPRRIMTFDLVV